ncbi:RING-H2 finger protein ATL33-like [Salvia miltiorrhiza]|uniref:RING-H2 finger protein ATL33-like n=1 Tax=Salvia miltiorrhiza TaxID=226208 RepID=UPI0025AC6A7E|nr:RING-H2 finger protein ATL33-like [Salvia miltiorrhiza]
MTNFTSINSTAPPPSTAAHAHPHSSYMSPLPGVLCLVALIAIPVISYTFFMAIRCPRRGPAAPRPAAEGGYKSGRMELVCGVKYRKTAASGGEPCPVCLSVLAEGEEIRQLSACKHAFHAACVDVWLYSHSSCPVCRATVPVKRALTAGEDDFHHGLPDAATLI